MWNFARHFNMYGTLTSAVLACCAANVAHAEGMTINNAGFVDGHQLPLEYAGAGQCGGKNVSPAMSWSHLPAGARSVVVTLKDPNGPKGTGVTHWLAYNIPSSVTSLPVGASESSPPDITVGQNFSGAVEYRGPCPPVGDTPHHYILTVTATDLAPGALPSGLDNSGLDAALKGHTLSGTSIVALYGR